MSNLNKIIITIITIFCFNTSSFAHYIWIELENETLINNEQIIRIYYGEFNEGLRELSGGKLEELNGIESWVIAPDGEKLILKVTKLTNYYQVKFTPTLLGNYTIIAINTVREVVDWSKYGIGIVKPTYYTSSQIKVGNKKQSSTKSNDYPTMVVVPHKKNNAKQTFQLLFENKPLASTKIVVHASNKWSKQYKTDKNGFFSFNPLWEGRYVIECVFREKKDAIFMNKKYKAIRHRVTYSYIENMD